MITLIAQVAAAVAAIVGFAFYIYRQCYSNKAKIAKLRARRDELYDRIETAVAARNADLVNSLEAERMSIDKQIRDLST